MIFHLGCGHRTWPLGLEFSTEPIVNVDLRHLGHVHTIGDVSRIDWLVDHYGRPDKIAAEDVLEHLPRARAEAALANWCEHLAAGGLLHVRTPDLGRLATRLVNGELTLDRFVRRIYGDQNYPENAHQCGFTLARLCGLIDTAGLRVVRTHDGNLNAWVWAEKPQCES
jgi:methyltransferase family protein